MDNNSSKTPGKKWDKKLEEKERNRYDLFPFVLWIGFGCLPAAAAIAAAATGYLLFIISAQPRSRS